MLRLRGFGLVARLRVRATASAFNSSTATTTTKRGTNLSPKSLSAPLNLCKPIIAWFFTDKMWTRCKVTCSKWVGEYWWCWVFCVRAKIANNPVEILLYFEKYNYTLLLVESQMRLIPLLCLCVKYRSSTKAWKELAGLCPMGKRFVQILLIQRHHT